MKRVIHSFVFAGLALLATFQESESAIKQTSSGLPFIHRDKFEHIKFIPTDLDHDINALIYDQIDYVTFSHQFTEEFLHGLLKEMEWVEERYKQDFIDSQIKRNSGPEVKDDDYDNYHRISKVYWLTFITKEDMK
jgi:hypothetical protein